MKSGRAGSVEHGLQQSPDIVEDDRLALHRRMYAIAQHQAGLIVYTFENEGQETQVILIGQVLKNFCEEPSIVFRIVCGQFYARQ